MNQQRRFRILEVLGQGGFGRVYRAEMIGADGGRRQVALKVMDASGSRARDLARRMRDEARVLSFINHRAVVGVEDLVPLPEGWGVVMELVDGADLSTALKIDRALPPAVALGVVEEVAGALHAAWTATPAPDAPPLRLVHRDVKPANIRVTGDGTVKLLDFGVALADFDGRELTDGPELIMGSERYMAPERRSGIEGHRGDVYSLGIVLANGLTGKRFPHPPVDRAAHARFLGTILEHTRLALGASEIDEVRATSHDVRILLLQMLAYEPADRPDAHEIALQAGRYNARLPRPWLKEWAADRLPKLMAAEREARQHLGEFTAEEMLSEITATATPNPLPAPDRLRPQPPPKVEGLDAPENGITAGPAAAPYVAPPEVAEDAPTRPSPGLSAAHDRRYAAGASPAPLGQRVRAARKPDPSPPVASPDAPDPAPPPRLPPPPAPARGWSRRVLWGLVALGCGAASAGVVHHLLFG